MAERIVRIPGELIEQAREALCLEEDTVYAAIVRKALIQVIGDETMTHEVKRGRPPLQRSA